MAEVAPQDPDDPGFISALDRATQIWGDASITKTLSYERQGWTGKPLGELKLVEPSLPAPTSHIEAEDSKLETAVAAISFSALGGLLLSTQEDVLHHIPESIALNPLTIALGGCVAITCLIKRSRDNQHS